MTPCEHTLGDSVKEKLSCNRKKSPADVGSGRRCVGECGNTWSEEETFRASWESARSLDLFQHNKGFRIA